MKRFTSLFTLSFIVAMGMQAQGNAYNYFENADGQHGCILIGDVDNDGDLDVLIGGEQRKDPHLQRGGLYINDGKGNFTKKDCPIMVGFKGNMDFGDIDGDGDLDIIFTGHKNLNVPEASARGLALNDGKGNFTIADPAKYPTITQPCYNALFADLNNDGLLDYMLTPPDMQGHFDWEANKRIEYKGKWTLFFQQPDGTFKMDENQFSNYFRDEVCSFGDFDNDGDVDIFFQGYYPRVDESITPFGLDKSNWTGYIFVNDGKGHFSRQEYTELPPLGHGSHDWADVDGNGFLDLLIVGDGPFKDNNNWDAATWYHRLFTNQDMVFKESFVSDRARPYSTTGANLLQDLDNDGDVDILCGGFADKLGKQKTFVYANEDADGNITQEDFVENKTLGDNYLPGFSEHDYKAADLNGDYILDYVYMGFKGGNKNMPPTDKLDVNFGGWTPGLNDPNFVKPFVKLNAPNNLTATQTADGEQMKVTFAWSEPDNIGTKKSVTYNLALRNKTTGKWLYNPMAIIGGEKDGFRQVVKMGNTYLNKSWTLTLPKGEYEWTVQAIDPARFGGSFAPMQTLSVSTNVQEFTVAKPVITTGKGYIGITSQTANAMQAKVYSTTGVEVENALFENSLRITVPSGLYIVEVKNGDQVLHQKVTVK